MRDYDLIGSMTVEDLREELVGKTIESVDEVEKTITLTDGTKLRFIDAQDCCAWFASNLFEGNLVDNAVTDVVQEWHESEEVPEAWTLHVLAADKNLVDVDIWGDSTSGYYCRSITLRVEMP